MSSKSAQVAKTFAQLSVKDSSATKTGSTTQVTLRRTSPSVTIATGSATLTAAQTTAGILSQTPAANSTLTLASATALLAVFPSVQVGDTFNITIINLAAATFNTVLAVPASGTLVGSGTVVPLTSATFALRFTDVATPAYTVFSL